MRIVGGKHLGRRLESPAGMDIRPTSDRAREALFNILSHGKYAGEDGAAPLGQSVLDVFAGTGAMGLEALSRGAASVCFIEQNRTAARQIMVMAKDMGEADAVNVITRDATKPGPARENFDLVLMDIQMPILDGYEASQQIRKLEGYRDTPIIAMTANAMRGDREKAIQAGMNDHLTKPIDVDLLYQQLLHWRRKTTC